MADNVQQLEQRFSALLQKISPPQRRILARNIARQLSQSQRQRIKAQKNPDHSAYEPRKATPLRNKKGRIKNQLMFRKLGGRLLRSRTTSEQVTIGYQGSNAYVARVHQYGLKSYVRKNRDYKVKYAQRELLGITDDEIKLIENLVIAQLAMQT